jgi:hypothetical protein
MFNIFKKLFPVKPKEIEEIDEIIPNDPDFGYISFFESNSNPAVGIWQMHENWEMPEDCASVGCSSIPGTIGGPDPNARAFLLSKKASLQVVWNLVADRLEMIRCKWRPDTGQQDLRQVFRLTSLSLDEPITDPPNWEVAFEPVDGKWIFARIQLSGDNITGHGVDT